MGIDAQQDVRITFDMYAKMYRRLHDVFKQSDDAADELDDTEYKRALEKDWKHDAQGHDALTGPLLRKSIFQIADMWVDSTNAHDYSKFLDKLHGKMFPKKKK